MQQLTDFRIDATELPKLHDAELAALWTICQAKGDTFPHYCGWLMAVVEQERKRRNDPSRELGLIDLPKCNGHQLGEFLMAANCFCRWPFPESTCLFLDQIESRAICTAAVALSTYLSEETL